MSFQWWCVAGQRPWSWTWQPYPGVWIFVLALAAAYVWVARSGAARSGRARPAAFATGLLLLWAALDWPLGALGASYLATAHMVQFLLVGLVAPAFLLLGVPPRAYEALRRRGALLRPIRALTHPLLALLLFGVTLGVTHWPPVVDTLMPSQLGSFALDLAWLGAGLVFWWPVIAPVPERPRFGYPVKMGYLLLGTIVNTAPFLFLTFSRFPVYAIYELAPPVSWLTTREDQIVAGLLMKMGGAAVLWTAITILFARWYRSQEDLWGGGTPGPATGRGAAALLLGVPLLAATACGGSERSGPVYEANGVEVADAALAEPLAGGSAALYLTLRNTGGGPSALVGFQLGETAGTLHRTTEREGRSVMEAVTEVPAPPGDTVRLRPGGYHGMVVAEGLRAAAGDTVEVTLRFRRGAALTFPVPVVPYARILERFGEGRP